MCNSQNAIVILFLLFFSLSFSFGFHIDALLKYFQGTMCAKNNLISQANTVIYGLQIYVISIVKLVVLTSAGLSICGCTITTSTPCMHLKLSDFFMSDSIGIFVLFHGKKIFFS